MFIFIKNGEADMGIELFPHNQTAYESALSLLKEYGKAAVIHPTGTGKSMIAFKLAEEYPASRICWLAPSAYIFKTQLENLKREGGDALLNIVFLTYAALMKMEKDGISELSPDCIVLDEFHRCGAVEWGKGVARLLSVFPSAKILGLSATAVRFLDNQRDMAAELFDGHVASELTLGEAVVSGILPTPVYVLSFYSFQKELDAWGGRVAAAVSQKQKAQGERILQKLRRAIEQADGLDVVFKRHMKERAGKYLLFCADRGHMEEMMRHVREWFWRVDKEPHVYSVYFGNPASLKEFEAFKADKSDHLKLLFCIDLLNEGVHVEDVSGVILLRPTASPTLYLQQIGRSLSSGKSGQPVIFDIVNNFDSLCCIDFLKEEMRSALAMRGQEDAQEMFPHRFSIIDETGDCRKLFMQLKENLKADFEAYYRVAEEYHREYGDLNVPKNYSSKNGFSLGSWLASLRRARAGKIRGSLTKEQILRLDTLGMVWELPSEANWERGIKALEEYFREHGDANVKAAYAAKDGFRLGRWVSNLRQKAGKEGGLDFLTEEQKNRLLAVGMVWDVNAYRWEQNYEAARQYFLEHGNLEVPAKYCARDGKKLGVWIQNQKQAYAGKKGAAGLTAEQVKKLMELGLEFKKQGTAADIRPNERNQKTDSWEERYRIAADYYRRTGSLAVPQNCVSGGVWIGKWLCEQRKRYRRQDGAAPLSDIQAKKLEAIGMDWRTPHESAWEAACLKAEAYQKEHGNLEVPKGYRSEGGFRLDLCLNRQKKNYRNGSLDASRKERLTALGIRL